MKLSSIFTAPAEPFILFNYSDIAILLIINISLFLVLRNYRFKSKRVLIRLKILLSFLLLVLYVFIIPVISIIIEDYNVHKAYQVIDSFNLFYIVLKSPIWWLIGIINILLMYVFWPDSKGHE